MDRRAVLQQWMTTHERGPTWVASKTGYSREWIGAVLHGQKPFSNKLARVLTEVLGIDFSEDDHSESGIEFVANPAPRSLCLLLLDTSAAMHGRPLAALQESIRVFKDDLLKDIQAVLRVEVALFTFNPAVRAQDFVLAPRFAPPILTAQGAAHLGATIDRALDRLEARQAQYRAHGISSRRPWVFVVTAGAFSGEDETRDASVVQRLREADVHTEVVLVGVENVENADLARLKPIAGDRLHRVQGLNFRPIFRWLASSLRKVSSSKIGEPVTLSPMEGVDLVLV